jgi:hypothetical protein
MHAEHGLSSTVKHINWYWNSLCQNIFGKLARKAFQENFFTSPDQFLLDWGFVTDITAGYPSKTLF